MGRDFYLSLTLTLGVFLLFIITSRFVRGDATDRIFLFLLDLQIVLTIFTLNQNLVATLDLGYQTSEGTAWMGYNLLGLLGIITLWYIHRKVGIRTETALLYATFHAFNFVSGMFLMYLTTPYWDILTHFLGAFILGILLYAIMRKIPGIQDVKKGYIAVVAILAAGFLASIVEIVEYVGHLLVVPDATLSYRDTIGDMFVNSFGALFGTYYAWWREQDEQR
jgi:hypothetical protein